MYQKSKEESLTRELFQNPTNEYRGAPFWAWNQALSPEVLVRHIDYFKEMGIGGIPHALPYRPGHALYGRGIQRMCPRLCGKGKSGGNVCLPV